MAGACCARKCHLSGHILGRSSPHSDYLGTPPPRHPWKFLTLSLLKSWGCLHPRAHHGQARTGGGHFLFPSPRYCTPHFSLSCLCFVWGLVLLYFSTIHRHTTIDVVTPLPPSLFTRLLDPVALSAWYLHLPCLTPTLGLAPSITTGWAAPRAPTSSPSASRSKLDSTPLARFPPIRVCLPPRLLTIVRILRSPASSGIPIGPDCLFLTLVSYPVPSPFPNPRLPLASPHPSPRHAQSPSPPHQNHPPPQSGHPSL